MTDNKESFWAVIPGTVMYDQTISANAKLLYGQISALCNKEGFCWATNNYFSDLNGVSTNSISKWINELKAAGHIEPIVDQEKGNARCIYLSVKVTKKTGIPTNIEGRPHQLFEDTPHQLSGDTPYINKKIKKRIVKPFVAPTLEQVIEYCSEHKRPKEFAERVFNHYNLSDPPWHDSTGKPVVNWKQKIYTNWISKNYDHAEKTEPNAAGQSSRQQNRPRSGGFSNEALGKALNTQG